MFETEKLERGRQRIESQCQLPCVDNTHVTRLCSYGHDLSGVFFFFFVPETCTQIHKAHSGSLVSMQSAEPGTARAGFHSESHAL